MHKNLISLVCAVVTMFLVTDIAIAKATKPHNTNNSSLSYIINSMLPKENIEVKQVRNSIVLSGTASSSEIADKAEKLAKEYIANNGKVLNFMKIKNTQQVMLRVKVGEIIGNNLSSSQTDNLGFDDLEQRGLIKLVAEPNLVAISGEKAEFLSGGEFPVPTSQKDGIVSVDYKSYGIKLSFLPIVLSPNRIRLNVEQETSELSKNGTVQISGITIPAVTSRRAKTTIELAPGEGFMIAGLVKDELKHNRRFSNELVISVTPYLVDPVTRKNIRFPTNDRYIPTQLEKKFIEKVSNTNNIQVNTADAIELEGPIGFIAE
ncbi:Flp pilus assembly protein, secretin CpaC [Rickettsiales bacterium Ac37b]|nr:Flp pilus assembly protein, secretin CpaC [Rickettsiales bacterium Ac37b]